MIPVVDIFAGPGGLSEGFSAVHNGRSEPAFEVVLSVEKEARAFETLRLRTFFRQFAAGEAPPDYYDCLRGRISTSDLYARYPLQAKTANDRTWHAELGNSVTPLRSVRKRINSALQDQENWVLIGGPPCQAYSIAGRSRNRGNPEYKPSKDTRQRLYIEYLQILADHRPAVFVMENVKGLLSAKLRNQRIFRRIVEDLQNPVQAVRREARSVQQGRSHQYRIYSLVDRTMFTDGDLQSSVIRAEQYGIPQARHRVILLGLRDDLSAVIPRTLKPQTVVFASSVLDGMPALRSGLSRIQDSSEAWRDYLRSQVGRRWANAGTVRVDGKKLSAHLKQVLSAINPPELDRGGEFVEAEAPTEYAPRWFHDSKLKGICNHSTRGHMAKDLRRYIYAACYARIHGRSPTLQHFPTDLLPDHLNVDLALEEGGNFSDRFRVQVADRPATTVTSHISKDGHYYIHNDPMQCRSLTVREAARLQTFPDNYFFMGPRTAQYTQVGNAVPPLLAKQIGAIVLDVLEQAGMVD